IAATASDIPYGTPMMGLAVGRAAAAKPEDVIAMGGHEDGVLAFGPTPRQAALCLLVLLAKALELEGPPLP
ncbi:MAG: class II aldolase/adducin family protein, partial [Candidatus Methylumidiphilus sp.]